MGKTFKDSYKRRNFIDTQISNMKDYLIRKELKFEKERLNKRKFTEKSFQF